MYVATPPAPSSGAGPSGSLALRVPLPLERMAARTFGPGRPYAPELVRYLCDLSGLYGLPQREDYFGRAKRNTFTDMARVLLGQLVPPEDPFDLVVLAHSTPDAEPGWPACHLASALPGEPLAFAVSDQGVTAPFTALRIAASYISACDLRRAMIVILDQRTVLRDLTMPPSVQEPTCDSIVALVLASGGALGDISVCSSGGLGPARARTTVAEQLSRHSAERPLGTLLTSLNLPGLHGLPPETEIVPAPPGMPCTGTWTGLAGRLEQWGTSGPRHVAIADYEEALGYLGVCFLERPAAGDQERPR